MTAIAYKSKGFKNKSLSLVFVLTSLCMGIGLGGSPVQAQAACPALPTDNGTVTSTVTVPADGSYRVWSRIMAPNSTDNSYYLEIDNTTCGVNVGDAATIPANTWTWVDYQGGNSAIKVNVTLSAGTHTVTMIGKEAGVKLDRIILTSDTGCVPTGTGDNCASEPDTTNPSVSLTAPSNGATVSNSVAVTANASDNVAVSKVEFLVDGAVVNTDTAAPYSFSLDTLALSNGSHSLTARATDAAGNTATSAAVSVTVNNAAQFSCAGSAATICEDFSASAGNFINSGSPGSGDWGVTGGKYSLANPSTGGISTVGLWDMALHNTNVSGDFTLTADGSVVQSSGTFNDFNVVFGYQDDNNYYYASLAETNDGFISGIFKVAAGVQTQLADVTEVITPDTIYALKLERTANTFKFYRNNTQVASATDATFGTGKVGFGTRGDAATFDNLVVTAAGSVTPPADTTAPTTSITSPANGATVSNTVTVNANASDNVGVAKVELYIDGSLAATDVATPFVFSWNTTTYSNASHVLTTKAYDTASAPNVTTSTAITVTVNNVVSPGPKPGDVNGDNSINGFDLSTLLTNWSQSGRSRAQGDLSGDGVVNGFDLSQLLTNWGR